MTINCLVRCIKMIANIRLSPLGVDTKVDVCYTNEGIASLYITYTTKYTPIRKERVRILHHDYCLTGDYFSDKINTYAENARYTRAHFLTCLEIFRKRSEQK